MLRERPSRRSFYSLRKLASKKLYYDLYKTEGADKKGSLDIAVLY